MDSPNATKCTVVHDATVPSSFLSAIKAVEQRTFQASTRASRHLSQAIRDLSETYTRNRAEIGPRSQSKEALWARLMFFLPRDVLKITRPLTELASVQALPSVREWRVLDVGAGLGASTFGVAWFASQTQAANHLLVTAIDHDERALDIMSQLARADHSLLPITANTIKADLHHIPIASLPGQFDLILLGFVLNEIRVDVRQAFLENLSSLLAPDGSIIVLEPALRTVSRELHTLRDRIVTSGAPLHVFAPCVRAAHCPMLENERDWCHEELDIDLPEEIATFAKEAGLRDHKLTFSYLTLRKDTRSLRELHKAEGELYRIVSSSIRTKGKLELFGCGQLGKPRIVRLNRNASPDNACLDSAHRGTMISINPGEPQSHRVEVCANSTVTLVP